MKPVFWWTIAIVCTLWVAFGAWLIFLTLTDTTP